MNRLRKHRLTGVLYLATGCLALPANAQVVQEYEYEPNRIYQVRTGLGITTQIELSPNEEVIDYSTGFSSGWDLTRRDNVFYLKPKNVDVDTNMMIRQSAGGAPIDRTQHTADRTRTQATARSNAAGASSITHDDDVDDATKHDGDHGARHGDRVGVGVLDDRFADGQPRKPDAMATQQGGRGLMLTMQIISAPPMAAVFSMM